MPTLPNIPKSRARCPGCNGINIDRPLNPARARAMANEDGRDFMPFLCTRCGYIAALVDWHSPAVRLLTKVEKEQLVKSRIYAPLKSEHDRIVEKFIER